MNEHRVICSDCLGAMSWMPDASIDSIVTDPPYGLSFMGKAWDHGVPGVPFWAEALRVAKPGAYLVAFGGTRTYHRLACAIEDAGWEVRDCLSWLYGSGFPKSLDVAKAMDKVRDDTPEILRVTGEIRAARIREGRTNAEIDALFGTAGMAGHWTSIGSQPTIPTWDQWLRIREFLVTLSDEVAAEVWRLNGRKGTPGEAFANRPVLGEVRELAARPGFAGATYGALERRAWVETLAGSEISRAWQGWGTALKPAWEPAIVARKPLIGTVAENVTAHGTGGINVDACRVDVDPNDPNHRGPSTDRAGMGYGGAGGRVAPPHLAQGRWPANVLLDEEAAAALDAQTGTLGRSGGPIRAAVGYGGSRRSEDVRAPPGDSGGASRFFYCAKASKSERGAGNTHPTVKPLALMRWIVRLVTPPGGIVLDPFAGSGTTGLAAHAEGMSAILVEREPAYARIIAGRLEAA